jgi:hypothetical protein
VVSATRALLDTHTKAGADGKKISLISGTHVRALTGVRAERVDGIETSDGRQTRADLVIDATGSAGSSGWLRRLELPVPAEHRVRVNVGYATRMLRRGAGQLDGLLLAGVADTPPRPRFGVAFAVDGDRWQVTLGGWHGDHAPADPAAYREFAASLPNPLIAQLLDDAEPLTAVRSHTFPASRRRYYERLPDPPAGYVAIGDALCAVNPIYGQGMTMAVLQAVEARPRPGTTSGRSTARPPGSSTRRGGSRRAPTSSFRRPWDAVRPASRSSTATCAGWCWAPTSRPGCTTRCCVVQAPARSAVGPAAAGHRRLRGVALAPFSRR